MTTSIPLTLEELDRCATYITRPDLCSVYGLCEYLAALIPQTKTLIAENKELRARLSQALEAHP